MHRFHATDRFGNSIDRPSLGDLRRLLASLDEADDEHPDVALTHESEWSLGVRRSGVVVFENLESDDPPMHQVLTRDEALDLWVLLSHGRIDELLALPWRPGYGH